MEVCQVEKKYYLGLDVGTDSVGWAVTDETYKIMKYKNNMMWGVHLFDEAKQATERRSFRSTRRRYKRRKQRISMVQEFFADEIMKKDEKFFLRLKESALLPEDSENRKHNIYFDDKDYNDKNYFKDYPTIHHLICELMENKGYHDIRLVYLACSYLIANRGHFLFAVSKDNIEEITDFKHIYDEFYYALSELDEDVPFEYDSKILEEILKMNVSVTDRKKYLKEKLFGKKIPDKTDISLNYDKLLGLISGGTVSLSDIFENEEYKELEKNSICIKKADFTETLESLEGQIESAHMELIVKVKAMYEWSLLVDILKNHTNISKAKKEIYEEHEKDLKNLKKIVIEYLSHDDYKKIFSEVSKENNYARYVKKISENKKPSPKFEKCKNQEDFCKFIKKYLEKISPSENDEELLGELKKKCDNNSLCPKQISSDNRVIPYQLYYAELKKILENASEYFPFLKESDEYGTTIEKILTIMEFRVPYYVGPFKKSNEKDNAWIVRKAEGKIYPWNFKDMVDEDATEDKFIERMRNNCTYIAGEDVLPENSLLYCKYKVLNEINTISVDGKSIPVDIKQKLYEALFVQKKAPVTKKKIKDYLCSMGLADENSVITGVDDTIKSRLKSYHDFRIWLADGLFTEYEVEKIIARITVTSDINRLKKWLFTEYRGISKEIVKKIVKLKYDGYGRLSGKFLEEIYDTDKETGECLNIISVMWETNNNLMQILSSKYNFYPQIQELNNEYYQVNKKSIEERLEDMYVPVAVRRSITRTLDIVSELKKILKKAPEKIFIEMARGSDENQKGKRTDSRREKIEKSINELKGAEEFKVDKEKLKKDLASISDDKLRSDKYYLYFTQLGKCMYTGKSIDIRDLEDNNKWNIDHIWPQSKIKDDSIDNRVLVSSEANGKKDDKYPLNFVDSSWQGRMRTLWGILKERNLISEKKYNRLIRTEAFSEDELSNFISRQLVEVRQSTKAIANVLGEILPETEIVYVKAGLVSEFRQEMNFIKCRMINDLHHAKDAYLNIVVGNVFNARFTKNPLNFVRDNPRYSIKLLKKDKNGASSGVMAHVVKCGNNIVWDPKTSFDIVKNMMNKNSIRYVRYSYKRKGKFFEANPERKNKELVPRKKGLDPEKYGGYNSKFVSFFILTKVKNDIIFVPVYIVDADVFLSDDNKALELVYNALREFYTDKKYLNIKLSDISFPLKKRIIKIRTMIEIDGYRANIIGRDGRYLSITNAMSAIVHQEYNDYIKKIESFERKYKEKIISTISPFSKINLEMNLKVYDYFTERCFAQPFCIWKKFEETGEILRKGRDKFLKQDLEEQVHTLMKVIAVFKTGRSTTCDLESVGGAKNFHTERFNAVIDTKKHKNICIIDLSSTGLYEKKSENLLDL